MNEKKLNKLNDFEKVFLCSVLNRVKCGGITALPETLKYFVPEFVFKSIEDFKPEMSNAGRGLADIIVEKIS